MARFELHIEADTYGEFKFAVMDVARGILDGERTALKPPELPERKNQIKFDCGVKVAPPIGSERGEK